MRRLTRCATAFSLLAGLVLVPHAKAHAEDNSVGATPALGWSSWSFVRHNPTAATIDAQADAMQHSLAAAGFQYINLDDFWYQCPGSQGPNVDQFGRWVTDQTKFPSNGTEDGIAAVADHVHADGLKFGLYVTPGISKQAVAMNTGIEGTPYHADDIAEPAVSEHNYNCKGMVVIDYTKPGAQEFIDSWANEFASWGVDYLKIDGVGITDVPDIQAWSTALRQTGRPIHLELSNSLNITGAATWAQLSNGWRTGGDIECYSCESGGSSYPLTSWGSLSSRFNQVANWQPFGGPGAFNDYDSLELGNGPNDGLTPDERKTQMSLWALASSPLILGTDLTNLDPTDLALLTNPDVLAVDQDAIDAGRIANSATAQVFAKTEPNGDSIVGLFNTSASPEVISTSTSALGMPAASSYFVSDLWARQATETSGTVSANVPSHGVALYRVSRGHSTQFVPPSTAFGVTGLGAATAGQPITATATFTDNGTVAVRNVSLTVDGSTTTFPLVTAGQTVQATFQVTPQAPTTLFGSDTVTATDSYQWLGVRPITSTVDYPLNVGSPVLSPLRMFASVSTGRFAQLGSQLGIQGAGTDVFGSKNEYGVTYLPGAETDGTVATVQITAQQNTNAWAKAGIMVRNDVTTANSSPGFVILAEAPGHGYVVQWDSNGDGQLDSNSAPSNEGLGTAAYPTWLKLVRSGTTFTGYYSTDDVNWTLIDTVSVPSAAATQDVGVFMTAHNTGTTGEVDFDHFTVTPSS